MNRHHLFKPFLTALLTIAALAAGQSARAASTWTLTSTTSAGITTFTITRSESTSAETVYYRTVSLSALEGQHFTAVSGSLTFTAGQTSKTVTVTEGNPDVEVYRYQTGSRRSYRFEVLDIDGTVITHRDQTVNTTTPFTYSGTNVNNAIPNNSFVFLNGDPANLIGIGNCIDVAYTPPTSQVESSGTYQGYVLIDDSYDYSQKAATVSTNTLISSTGASAACLKAMGYKIYATVCFTMKEKNDGYYYVQIVPGTASASYDGADPNGSVNDPAYSVYKACFELKEGSGVYSGEGKMFFPHRFDYTNRAAGGLNGTGTSQTNAWTEFPLAESKLWQQKFKSGFRDNNTGSVVLDPDVASITTRFDCAGDDNDTWGFKDLYVRMGLVDATAPTVLNNYKVSGGRHQKGNIIYVSMPFSELVTVEGTPTLTTTWGTLSYIAGSGSNVLTFSGVIASNASGTLSISALSGTVKDLAGNAFSGTVSKNFSITLDATYVWSLSDLNQLAANTYEIATKTDLYRLANIVNVSRNECSGITFLQTQDIVCDAGYTPIGYQGDNDHSYFRGTYDGQGHTVSGITVTRTGNTRADKYIGLFGYIYEGTVQNVVLANSTFTGYNYVGGIAGEISWGTVRNCRVESSVTIRVGNSPAENFGGVVGYFHGSGALMTGCVSAATIENNGLTCNDCGGISGDVQYNTLKDCLYIGTSVTGTGYVGSIAGSTISATISNNYYTAISLGGIGGNSSSSDQDGARRARTITLGEGISLSGTETTYDVSGITAYGSTAIGYGGKIYSGAGQTLTLNYTGTLPEGYTVSYTVTRTSNGSDITASVLSGTTLTMPAYDITVTALFNITLDVPAASWQTFAAPVSNPTVASTGLTSGTYDLYRYDEATATWENHKASPFSLDAARGYLYRRTNATTLTFSGQLNSEATYSVSLTASDAAGDLKGFNLVGNPYPYKVLLDRAFYSLNADGTWQEHPDGDSLAVGQAALVHCSSAETLTFYAATRSTNPGTKGALPPLPKGLFLNEIEDEYENENTTLNNHRFAYFDGDRVVISGTGLLQAYDIMGRQLFAKELSTLNSQISILNFPGSGVYLLRLNGQTQKIVIR